VRLLVVEDDVDVADELVLGLRRHGYEVELVRTGVQALKQYGDADLILLDLGLPDLDGFEVCRQLRELTDIPIIAVTARSAEIDRVLGLRLGADDYIVKPYGFNELLARIEAVSRRAGSVRRDPATSSTTRTVGPLTIDVRTRRVQIDGQPVELTRKEFDLLALLASDPGALFTREQIIRMVWSDTWFGATRTLDVHVASVRAKLGNKGWIETVRGVGFRLAQEAP
jgi:DNA-binding response OmpR family regulator